MFARLFALVNRGLEGTRKFLRSRRLGEFRWRRGRGDKGDPKGEGMLFDDMSKVDAKGSLGKDACELKENEWAEGGGESGLS